MIRLPNPWLILGLCAVLAGGASLIGVKAYRAGKGACEARHEAELNRAREAAAKAAEIASRRESDRLAAEAERDALAMELEDAARADPGAGACGLGADSLRRLNRL